MSDQPHTTGEEIERTLPSELKGEPEHDPVLGTLSPPWGRTTKAIVAISALLFAVLLAYRFQGLIGQLVVAAMLAYLLNPLIVFVDERTPLERGHTILVVYLLVAAVFVGTAIALGVAAFRQTLNFIDQAPELIDRLILFVEGLTQRDEPLLVLGPFELRPATVDWDQVRVQVLNLIEPIFSQSGQVLTNLAQTTLGLVAYLFLVFVLSVYFAIEIPRMGDYVARAAQQPGYRYDAQRLMGEFRRVWSAYLRGQVLLGLVIGLVVWLSLMVIGVQNALALGLLSGLLEFVPVVGPLIGTGAAVIVAFFQPDNYLGLPPLQYALLVLAIMIVIQQLENNVLVPRIVGDALDLHPLLVIISVFMGVSLFGILGAILAAPVVATLKLLAIYAWRKMFDLSPFPEERTPDEAAEFSWWQRWQARLAAWRKTT